MKKHLVIEEVKNIIRDNKIKILEVIEFVLVFFLLYSWVLFRYKPTDLTLIFGIIIVNLLKKIFLKEKIIVNKKIFYLGILWMIWISYSFYIVDSNIDLRSLKKSYYINLVFKSILVCITFAQMKFSRYLYRYLLLITMILSLKPIFDGGKLLMRSGSYGKRLYIWDNPNYYAFILGIFVIVGMSVLISKTRKKDKGLASIIVVVSFLVLVMGPKSRNVILYLLILVSILFFIRIFYMIRKNSNFIRLVTIIIVSLLFITGTGLYVKKEARISRLTEITGIKKEARVLVYKEGIKIIKEEKNVLIGKGFLYFLPNKLKTPKERLSATHNDVIEITITQGIMGTFLYVAFITVSLIQLIKNYKMNNSRKEFVILGILNVSYFIFLGLFDNPIYQKRVLELIFLFTGIGLQKNQDKIA